MVTPPVDPRDDELSTTTVPPLALMLIRPAPVTAPFPIVPALLNSNVPAFATPYVITAGPSFHVPPLAIVLVPLLETVPVCVTVPLIIRFPAPSIAVGTVPVPDKVKVSPVATLTVPVPANKPIVPVSVKLRVFLVAKSTVPAPANNPINQQTVKLRVIPLAISTVPAPARDATLCD